MMLALIMLTGLLLGAALCYAVERTYEDAKAPGTSRSCSMCAHIRRRGMHAFCVCPRIRRLAGRTPTCVAAISDQSLCGRDRACFAPARKKF